MPATLEAKATVSSIPSSVARSERLYTGEDLLRHPEWGPCELIRGKVVRVCRPNFEHGELMTEITFALQQFVKSKKLGSVISGDSGVYLERGPDTVRGPDIYFISAERCPKTKDAKLGYLEVAPELCVEIVSPRDRFSTTLAKVEMYLAAGVQLVWVIDPKTRKVHIFRADRSTAMVGTEEVLSGENVLAGFELSLKELFSVLD